MGDVASLYDLTDQISNSSLLRPVIVKGRQIIRMALPVNTIPSSSGSIAGLGDFSMFDAIVLSPGGPTTQGKWQAGAAAVYVSPLPGGSMFAGQVTWQINFAVDSNRADTNFLTAQPVGIFHLGGGYYLRSSGVWTRDFENNRTLIPFGVGA